MPFALGPVLRYIGLGQYETVGTTEYVGATDRITIPDAFPTDLASVPRLFWALLPPSGAYEKSAVLHDYLCVELARQYNGTWRRDLDDWDPDTKSYPAKIDARNTDGLFRRVMRESEVGFCTRWAMWCGVRWGALANPARRAGWWRDAPAVLGITLLLLAVLMTVLVGTHLAVAAALDYTGGGW